MEETDNILLMTIDTIIIIATIIMMIMIIKLIMIIIICTVQESKVAN